MSRGGDNFEGAVYSGAGGFPVVAMGAQRFG